MSRVPRAYAQKIGPFFAEHRFEIRVKRLDLPLLAESAQSLSIQITGGHKNRPRMPLIGLGMGHDAAASFVLREHACDAPASDDRRFVMS